jgi:uncharacterized protein (UPF0332 family)
MSEKNMTVSFEDFLESAKVLLNNSDSKEIDFRNLISRSYYALFHLSREIAETLPLSTDEYEKQGSHKEIIVKFEKSNDNYLKRLGREINRLKKSRERADYDANEDVTRLEAAKHFYDIKDLIKKLEHLKMKKT